MNELERSPYSPALYSDEPVSASSPPDQRGMMVAAIGMMVVGWGGLYWLIRVTNQLPRVGPLWLFFVLLFIAVAGTVLPIARAVNNRLTPMRRALPPSGVLVRQSIWIGLYVVTCAWLQIPRVLSAPIALMLALALIVVEVFLRTREIVYERLE